MSRRPFVNNAPSAKDTVQAGKERITTLVGRYRGKIRSWAVVKEAVNDRGDAQSVESENLRNSRWVPHVGGVPSERSMTIT
jgi:GH35 family endo-1,4-beta-xylanase